VDGTIMDVRNMLVDMIMLAEKNIYMEQLFIYDKFVNDALIKRKLQLPDLDIKIIADHNGNFGMNGFPNTAFIKEMKGYGIEIKARDTVGVPITYPNGAKFEYHQENHRKIFSVDGKVLLGGSSNLNPDTLQGAFREFGAQLFDRRQISTFEGKFLAAWNDPNQTKPIQIDSYKMPLKGKVLSVEGSALINDFASTLIRSKDELEKRY
jgi:phosphatidylserine/phosphatidylglycerophosphate/cardiolipin synthase-like enzyme